MKKVMADVAEFHRAMSLPVLTKPQIPNFDRRKLRQDLLEEEYTETIKALIDDDLEKIADGLADMVYVIAGLAYEYGIPLEKVWDEVHRSNMAKMDKTTGKPIFRADGKILKPRDWTPPDIASILTKAA